jgi:hypothetical protein
MIMALKSIAKMDAFSDMRVPFDVSTWLRKHRYNVTTVAIRKTLAADADLAERIERLEREREAQEGNLRDLIEEARMKMESADGV